MYNATDNTSACILLNNVVVGQIGRKNGTTQCLAIGEKGASYCALGITC